MRGGLAAPQDPTGDPLGHGLGPEAGQHERCDRTVEGSVARVERDAATQGVVENGRLIMGWGILLLFFSVVLITAGAGPAHKEETDIERLQRQIDVLQSEVAILKADQYTILRVLKGKNIDVQLRPRSAP